MKIGADAMGLPTKCEVMKSKTALKSGSKATIYDCKLISSTSAGITTIDIPDRNIKIALRTQNLMEVMNASNQKYKELRQAELGIPLVKENISHPKDN